MLIDTHCHIHEVDYKLPLDEVLARADKADVRRMICVGTNIDSSHRAVEVAAKYEQLFASIGVHPHEAIDGLGDIAGLVGEQKVVAVGEIGLDYFYDHSPRDVQIRVLEEQIQLALDNNLPIIFHVRDAFADFWPIFDNFHGIRGVLHSFTDTQTNLEQGFERGLYVGVNGISTFTKDPVQQELFGNIPRDRILFETDAPFLTPTPYRGTINEPAYVSEVAKFHASARGISLDDMAASSTANAQKLFNI